MWTGDTGFTSRNAILCKTEVKGHDTHILCEIHTFSIYIMVTHMEAKISHAHTVTLNARAYP